MNRHRNTSPMQSETGADASLLARPGWLLAIVLLLAIISLGFVARRILDVPSLPASEAIMADDVPRPSPAGQPSQRGSVPGFERRGASLVGEFIGRDGQMIRLVLDARTQKLIGARIVPGAATADSPVLPR